MTVVTATDFKAHCLSLMDRARRTRQPLLITEQAFRADTELGLRLGFEGTLCIHPR
jgi:hypothetical protein